MTDDALGFLVLIAVSLAVALALLQINLKAGRGLLKPVTYYAIYAALALTAYALVCFTLELQP